MPTTKKRLNLSLPPNLELVLTMLAARDNVPQATKAVQLLEMAIEIEEDQMLSKIAEERSHELEAGKEKLYTHDEFWELALS